MDDEIIGTFRIDPCLDHYRTFFSEEWNKKAEALVKGTKLEGPLAILITNWKAAANTHVMPWLMIHSLHTFWHGWIKHQNISARLINALAVGLPKRMPGKVSNMTQKKIAEAVREIAAELKETLDNDPDPEMEPETLWKSYIDQTSNLEFQTAIWGSQRLAFGALYFAFEHFVATLVAIGLAKDEKEYSPNWNVLVADAKKVFDPIDPTLVEKRLDCEFIKIIRETRHCLVHRGGKLSSKLAKLNHGLVVDRFDVIQIMPNYNHKCIRHLGSRLTEVIETALKLPAFQRA